LLGHPVNVCLTARGESGKKWILNVLIRSIDNPQTVSSRGALELTRFDVEFEGVLCSGKAHLLILHSSSPINVNAIREKMIDHSFEFATCVNTIHEFEVLSGCGQERVVPLGLPGCFQFEGRIVKHVFTGEGSIFQCGDIVLELFVEMLPPDSLEVPEGTWVTFKSGEFAFWIS
jgi:hypothetical protein